VDVEVDIHELAIGGQRWRQLVIGLEEGGLALQAVVEIDLLADRHADVAGDDQHSHCHRFGPR
jgi:hypothetical protein